MLFRHALALQPTGGASCLALRQAICFKLGQLCGIRVVVLPTGRRSWVQTGTSDRYMHEPHTGYPFRLATVEFAMGKIEGWMQVTVARVKYLSRVNSRKRKRRRELAAASSMNARHAPMSALLFASATTSSLGKRKCADEPTQEPGNCKQLKGYRAGEGEPSEPFPPPEPPPPNEGNAVQGGGGRGSNQRSRKKKRKLVHGLEQAERERCEAAVEVAATEMRAVGQPVRLGIGIASSGAVCLVVRACAWKVPPPSEQPEQEQYRRAEVGKVLRDLVRKVEESLRKEASMRGSERKSDFRHSMRGSVDALVDAVSMPSCVATALNMNCIGFGPVCAEKLAGAIAANTSLRTLKLQRNGLSNVEESVRVWTKMVGDCRCEGSRCNMCNVWQCPHCPSKKLVLCPVDGAHALQGHLQGSSHQKREGAWVNGGGQVLPLPLPLQMMLDGADRAAFLRRKAIEAAATAEAEATIASAALAACGRFYTAAALAEAATAKAVRPSEPQAPRSGLRLPPPASDCLLNPNATVFVPRTSLPALPSSQQPLPWPPPQWPRPAPPRPPQLPPPHPFGGHVQLSPYFPHIPPQQFAPPQLPHGHGWPRPPDGHPGLWHRR